MVNSITSPSFYLGLHKENREIKVLTLHKLYSLKTYNPSV